jgi:hypothetical protein
MVGKGDVGTDIQGHSSEDEVYNSYGKAPPAERTAPNNYATVISVPVPFSKELRVPKPASES